MFRQGKNLCLGIDEMGQVATYDEMTIEQIEAAAPMLFDEISDLLILFDANRKRVEIFSQLLAAAKKKVPHGKWEDWLTDTFQGRLPMRTAQRWMQSKAPSVALLESSEELIEPGHTDVQPESVAAVEVIEPEKSAKPRREKPATEPVHAEVVDRAAFRPGERLHKDREQILSLAGDWMSEKKLADFVRLLKEVLQQLEGAV
jgi:hypothetical protein